MPIPERRSPRFSIVIPTFQRKDVVLRNVQALERQEFEGEFEIVVVVDGSTDGTTESLRRLDIRVPLTIVEQPNRGAARARNHGAAKSRGEILLFLDDDMEADPRMIAEHDRSHREGNDAVLGHLPLHPESPDTLISRKVQRWAERRLARLTAPGAQLALHDLLTGQISVSRCLFQEIGGFDTDFTEDGTFGNEDVDFGYRLWNRRCRIVFNSRAISWQHYIVRPRVFLKQWYDAGKADVLFARKHPDQMARIFKLKGGGYPRSGAFWRPLLGVPPLATMVRLPLREAAVRLVEKGATGYPVDKLFMHVRAAEYWRGVRDAGGLPLRSPVRVLAYHAIRDLGGAGILQPYGVPPDTFRRQLDTLLEAGFRFISADTFLSYVVGRCSIPDRAVLLTFDDCYCDLLNTALPILRERNIPAVAFAVSGLLGGANIWDQYLGAPLMPLLGEDGLRALVRGGIEIGAHSRSHPQLTRLESELLSEEIIGSVRDIELLGLPRPRMFSYPHGVHNPAVRAAVQSAGIDVAFTVKPGFFTAASDPLRVPRIEVLRQDGVARHFWWKIATAGRIRWSESSTVALLFDLIRSSRRVSRIAV
jgi:glycosyltransferase involved in cell wall biosynthesis/peptidoglycan/xylan/chitin deacetylase (PgdA/CDA1 family)